MVEEGASLTELTLTPQQKKKFESAHTRFGSIKARSTGAIKSIGWKLKRK
jgi:hypothetical protein